MIIYIGSDHRGFDLKEKIKGWLLKWGYETSDLGAKEYTQGDDYPFYAKKLAEKIAKEKESRGILICGSGVGMDWVVNKNKKVRAGIGFAPKQIEAGRREDDMNVLVLSADYTAKGLMADLVKAFLETEFSGEERYIRRLRD